MLSPDTRLVTRWRRSPQIMGVSSWFAGDRVGICALAGALGCRAYVRTVKTSSGATAVQIVHSSRRGSRDIEHIGSAHDDVEVELLKAVARQRLAAGQDELDLGLNRKARSSGDALPPRPWSATADHVDADGALVGCPRARLRGARRSPGSAALSRRSRSGCSRIPPGSR